MRARRPRASIGTALSCLLALGGWLAGCREGAAANAQAKGATTIPTAPNVRGSSSAARAHNDLDPHGPAAKANRGENAHAAKAAASTKAPPDPLPVLREHVRADDVDAALAQLDALPRGQANAPILRYLRARMYERKERLRDALQALPEALDALPREVALDIRKRRALWQASQGQCAQAAPEAAALDDREASVSLKVADCALAQDDAATALSLLRAVRGSARRSFELRHLLSRALKASGDKQAAIEELRALYQAYPEHAQADAVVAQLDELLGGFQPSDDERFARAQRWLDIARPEEALDELSHVKLKSTGNRKQRQAQRAQRARLLHLKGMALFRTRTRYAEASKVLSQAAALGGATHTEDAFHSAQALARADRDREAVRAYNKFAKAYPKDRLATSALRNAAWLELRHDMPGGEAHMQAFLKRAVRSRSKRALAEPLWQLAQYAFKHKRFNKALPLFERYATTGEGPMVKARGLYWAGRCAALSGNKPVALRHYREAMAIEPLHWYALMAHNRIVAEGEEASPPLPGSVTAHAQLPDRIDPVELPAAAQFFAQLGLDDDAVEVLRAQETSWRRRGSAGLVQLLAAYHTLGEYSRPYQLAVFERHDTLAQPAGSEQHAVWTALYPRPFATAVAEAASREKIAQEIVFAVMRKESAFKPKVVSSADAIGLLQLIVATGKSNAAEIGLKRFERASLFEPSVNIRVGTHYLAQLISHYDGQAVPAIAAYNAGEHKVDDWLKRAKRRAKSVELDWFVEDIPFEQTRNYVRLVVTNWARYAYLKRPDAGWPLDLPTALPL